jgi:outer membrane protein assembly factor BamD (BamD/ComL family)
VDEPTPTTTENAPRPPQAKPAAAGPSEASLLQRAQAALRGDPARALTLTQEHRRRYPHGKLSQEREVIAIEALSRLGRSSEAGKRAEDFGKSYPGSAHQKKVETSVEQPKR